jgi:hypothetical protein
MSRRKKSETRPEPRYLPTRAELKALENQSARMATTSPAPSMKVESDGTTQALTPNHPNKNIGYILLMEAIGTGDTDFLNGLLGQMAGASSRNGEISENSVNYMLSVIKGIKPRDQLEAMLAAQMAVVHAGVMRYGLYLNSANTLPEQDIAERGLNKLTRTYTGQMEALKRYRTGGEQKVTVQHVSVSEGGQAIVGNVTHRASERAPEKSLEQKPALGAPQPMTIAAEPAGVLVPLRRKTKKDAGRSST